MAERILVHDIARRVEDVYPFFSDMHRFVSIHPVIYKCVPVADNCYCLHERIKMAGASFSFSYNVTIEYVVLNKQVIMFSEIRKGITLKLVFDFEEQNGKTQLTETVSFNGPVFIAPLFLSFLTRVHRRMIKGINS